MFFRLKPTRSGQVLKLVESCRDDTACPRHRALVSLGDAQLARSDWKPIAKAVEDHLYGREVLLTRILSESQVLWVDRILRQVSSEGRLRPFAGPSSTAEVIDGVHADAVTPDPCRLKPNLKVGWTGLGPVGKRQELPRAGRRSHPAGRRRNTRCGRTVMTQSILGWMLVVLGVLMLIGQKWSWLGHIPGDFSFERYNMTVFVPLGTSILVSFILCIVMALFTRR